VRLYIAGVFTANLHKTSNLYARLTEEERAARNGVEYYLESFHYINRESRVNQIREEGIKLFMDSGAFSAFTQGATIDLVEYVEYLRRNADIIEMVDKTPLFSVLDAIGDPLQTYRNQLMMEELGCKPLPCFHYGEDIRWLEWYMKHYDYITIGGMVPIETQQLLFWLDWLWEHYLCDGSGRPRLRVHGFGVTRMVIMERYPWYSVDSSSWVQSSANGAIMVPKFGNIFISVNSPSAKYAGRHIDTIPEAQKLELIKEIEKDGFTYERLRDNYLARWTYNLKSYTEIGRALKKENKVFIRDQKGLFE
jgi:hypothetical protein